MHETRKADGFAADLRPERGVNIGKIDNERTGPKRLRRILFFSSVIWHAESSIDTRRVGVDGEIQAGRAALAIPGQPCGILRADFSSREAEGLAR